jgi:Phosphotransferase enzyme family
MLRRIHAIDPQQVGADGKDTASAVLVHGDFGPQNVLLDAATREVLVVVDWERAHAGDLVEDLAWCEWIIRMHHPAHVSDLGAFFDAYGRCPAWPTRQRAMIAQCRALLAFCERWQPGGPSVHLWQQRLKITESWTELLPSLGYEHYDARLQRLWRLGASHRPGHETRDRLLDRSASLPSPPGLVSRSVSTTGRRPARQRLCFRTRCRGVAQGRWCRSTADAGRMRRMRCGAVRLLHFAAAQLGRPRRTSGAMAGT